MNLVLLAIFMSNQIVPTYSTFNPSLAENQHLIVLRTRSINTTESVPTMAIQNIDQTGSKRFLIHFNHTITPNDRNLVNQYGLRIESYLPHGAFLVFGTPANAGEMYKDGVIDWFGDFLPDDKIDPVLFENQNWDELDITLFPEVDVVGVAERLENCGVEIVRYSQNDYNGKLVVKLDNSKLVDIASVDGIRWVEPRYQIELHNDQCQWVIQTNHPGNRKIWEKGLDGEGVIGSTCDSGIYTYHQMFADSSVDIFSWGDYPNHRKIVAYKPTADGVGFGDSGGYISYHGTHTAGTVCGDDSYWEASSPYDGMAPKARLYFMDFDGYLYGLTDDYRDMYTPPYEGNEAGQPKFSSNSWGQHSPGYTSHSWETDQFTWEHPEFLLLFSAGNDADYVSAPATAKNVVTVGATMNGSSANLPASFSGSGPLTDGRTKPTVTAPGNTIISAQGDAIDSYKGLFGTSMSCPAVAGGVALITQYLREGWYPGGSRNQYHDDAIEPSAALLKAMLVASTDADFSGYPIPDGKIGWGRINLDSVLYFTGDNRKLYLHDEKEGLETGEMTGYEIEVADNSLSLRVTVVWTDYPPEMGATIQLVNNLDLEIHSPTGEIYYGNNFTNNYSTANGTPDAVNVVENVRIKQPFPGIWSVRIKGSDIPQGPQPYALVITGNLQYHDVNLKAEGIQIDDMGAKTPNGALDPEETVLLHPVISNIGSFDANAVEGTLTCEHDGITIQSSHAEYGDINSGNQSSGEGFTVSASADLTEGEIVTFMLEVQANQGGYARILEYSIPISTGVDENSKDFILSLQVMESPFTDVLDVQLSLPEPGPVRLDMFDESGRLVRSLIDDSNHQSGTFDYSFTPGDKNGKTLPKGVYFLRLVTRDKELISKGVKIK